MTFRHRPGGFRQVLAAGLALAAACAAGADRPPGRAGVFEWPMYKGGPARTGLAATTGPKAVADRPVWKITGTVGTPILVGGRMYVRGARGQVLELDPATGKTLRSVRLGARRQLSSAGGLLFTATDKTVIALDLTDLKKKWTFDAKEYISSSDVLPVGGRVYFGTFADRAVRALDAKTGQELWKHTGATEVSCTYLAADGTRLFVPFYQTGKTRNPHPSYAYYRDGRDAVLKALSLADGKELWKAPIGRHPQGSPAVRDGRVYLSPVRSKRILCLDAASGKELWKAGPVPGQPRDGGVVVGPRGAFCGGKPGQLIGIDLKTGKETFRFPARGSIKYICGAPVIADECIYFGDWGNAFYCCRIDSGRMLWRLDLKEKFTRSCLVADGRIYFGGHTGSLYCFAPAGGDDDAKAGRTP